MRRKGRKLDKQRQQQQQQMRGHVHDSFGLCLQLPLTIKMRHCTWHSFYSTLSVPVRVWLSCHTIRCVLLPTYWLSSME